MIRWIASLVIFASVIFLTAPKAYAEPALGMQPLQYTETLKKGERKKGFIDIANPQTNPVDVTLTVQGFKQVDDKGDLVFFDDERLRQGIVLDLIETQIPARKTLRLFFVIDSTKLPTGDVFAAIFAQTKGRSNVAVGTSVRLGSLLILTNGTPGARQVDITQLSVPIIQIGSRMHGQLVVKNTAPAETASGFFPQITITTWPFGPSTTVKGPLIYAGNTRTIEFQQPSNQLGIYKVTASIGSAHKDAWTIIVTGIWRWVMLGFTVILILTPVAIVLWRRRHIRRRT